jgi:hypothetical protein
MPLVLTAEQALLAQQVDAKVNDAFSGGVTDGSVEIIAPMSGYDDLATVPIDDVPTDVRPGVRVSYNTAVAVAISLISAGAPVAEGWHILGNSGEPALADPWVQAGSPHAPAGFYKDGDNVYLRGRLSSGPSGTSPFTLPVGYRPSHLLTFAVGGVIIGQVTVAATGVVTLTGSPVGINLDGIFFRIG